MRVFRVSERDKGIVDSQRCLDCLLRHIRVEVKVLWGGGEGEAGALGAAGFLETLEKNLSMPSFFSSFRSSISEGADESSDESSSDIMLRAMYRV